MDNGDLPIWHLKILFLGVSWKSALNCEHNDDMMVIAKFAANIVCHSLPSFFLLKMINQGRALQNYDVDHRRDDHDDDAKNDDVPSSGAKCVNQMPDPIDYDVDHLCHCYNDHGDDNDDHDDDAKNDVGPSSGAIMMMKKWQ